MASPAAPYFREIEPELAAVLDTYLAGLRTRLASSPVATTTVALVLSGGYGRGEGGVFRGSDGVAQLYNDLEFYFLLKTSADVGPAHAWCVAEEKSGTATLGIDVEFKCLAIGAFHAATPSMFYYDLLAGHRLIYGTAEWMQGLSPTLRDASLIPLEEATRLLFNRGSGLFFSRCALARDDERVRNGFMERNHAKIRLALGDAVLAANGGYHHSCVERHRRIAAGLASVPAGWAQIVAWHEQGVEFKLRPRHQADHDAARLMRIQGELAAAWGETFRWLEARRLGTGFADSAAYMEWSGRLFPETPAWRNVLLRVRDRRARGGALPGWTDYPRAALLRALVGLVDPAREPDVAQLARCLGLREAPVTWSDLEPTYARWWSFYN